MPLIATFSEVRLCGAEEGSAVCAAGFSVGEGVRSAVTQLPIAHSSFGYVDEKGNTSRYYANQSSSNPPGTSVEGREQSISNARSGMNRTKAVGIFDLAFVN